MLGSCGLSSIQLSLGLTLPTLSVAGCVILVKLLNLSELPFLQGNIGFRETQLRGLLRWK